MRRELRWFSILALWSVLASGCRQAPVESVTLSVRDEAGRPVEGVSIASLGRDAMRETDLKGNASMPWADGDIVDVEVSGRAVFTDTVRVVVSAGRVTLRVLRVPLQDGVYCITQTGAVQINAVSLTRSKSRGIDDDVVVEASLAAGKGCSIDTKIIGFLIKGPVALTLLREKGAGNDLHTAIYGQHGITATSHEAVSGEMRNLGEGWTRFTPQLESGSYAFVQMSEVVGAPKVSSADRDAVSRAEAAKNVREETDSELYLRLAGSGLADSEYLENLKQQVQVAEAEVAEAERRWTDAINTGPKDNSRQELLKRVLASVASVAGRDEAASQRAELEIKRDNEQARDQRNQSIELHSANYRRASDLHARALERYQQALIQSASDRGKSLGEALKAAGEARSNRRRVIDEGATAAERIARAKRNAEIFTVVSGTICYPFDLR